MKYNLTNTQSTKTDAFIYPLTQDLKVNCQICQTKNGLIQEYLNAGIFKGEKGELQVITKICGGGKVRYIILVGLGEKPTVKYMAKALSKAVLKAQSLKCETVSVALDNIEDLLDEQALSAVLVAMGKAEYSFDTYKTKEKHTPIEEMEVVFTKPFGPMIAKEAENLVIATNHARDLVNEPANVIKPVSLANQVKQLGQEAGFEVEVFGRSVIEQLGMKAYLAVAQGADSEPQLIVMRYKKNPEAECFGLVGKGVTYDTGGYSLKPSTSMDTMKTDMGGAAAVIGAMVAIAKNQLPVNVVGVVAACENMVSGHAIFPGDVVGSMCGKTIEVKNTDAEGRLTLIDAVTYALQKEKATKILDIATLTGAQVVALGDLFAGVLGNNEPLMEQLKKAAVASLDPVWQMPYDEDVVIRNQSKIADIMNIANVPGMGCSIGGAFVGEAIDDQPWVHVDIAGVAYHSSAKDDIKEGATGFGVGLIYQLLKQM